MPRYERNTAVLYKLEAAYSVDPVPVASTDAVLLRKFSCKPVDAKYVNREAVRPYFGKDVDLLAVSFVSGSFEVELASSGTLGTVPPWGKFLRSAAFAETISAGARVDYTMVSSALESAAMYYYDDGVRKIALGLRLDITGYKMGYGEVPTLSCNFIALDGGLATATTPALTLTAWKTPLPVNQANTGLLTLGCTYSAGALVGGTAYPSRGLELSLGAALAFTEILGGESVDITDRDVKGKITLDLTAAQEVAFEAIVKACTLQGLGMVHGTVAGAKILTHLPAVQLKNPSKENVNGRRLLTYEINAVPVSGNDEWRIVSI
jgi:hypothetical protein